MLDFDSCKEDWRPGNLVGEFGQQSSIQTSRSKQKGGAIGLNHETSLWIQLNVG